MWTNPIILFYYSRKKTFLASLPSVPAHCLLSFKLRHADWLTACSHYSHFYRCVRVCELVFLLILMSKDNKTYYINIYLNSLNNGSFIIFFSNNYIQIGCSLVYQQCIHLKSSLCCLCLWCAVVVAQHSYSNKWRL